LSWAQEHCPVANIGVIEAVKIIDEHVDGNGVFVAVELAEQKIKVLFFDEAVAFGGSVVVLAHLLNNIDRTVFEPKVVTSLDASAMHQLFASDDVLCWFRPALHYVNRVRWMARCPWAIKNVRRLWAYAFTFLSLIVNTPAYLGLLIRILVFKPDIIHVNNGREGLFAAKLLRIPLVWHLHGISADYIGKTYGSRDSAAIFISVSKHISSEAIRYGVAADRIVDIPNPAPVDAPIGTSRQEWFARFDIPPNAVVLAHVGRLLRWKGQLEFLQAFSKVANSYPQAVVLIVGDDVEGFTAKYPRSLQQLVAEHDLQRRVIFTGHITNILDLMAAADIVVHSSIEPEPFGLVITEAMSVGAAVVAARLGAPLEIIEHGVTGLLADPQNTDELAAALAFLLSDAERRRAMAIAGQNMVKERYSPAAFARRVESVYRDVMQRGTKNIR
jgi:glycosyltransferase involved in cell wall biosynthesis